MLLLDPRRLNVSAALRAVPDAPLWYFTVDQRPYDDARVHIKPPLVRTWNDYNVVLRSAWFWRQIPSTFALLFERDSFFCAAPTLGLRFFLDEMIQYEYVFVGAPWNNSAWWCKAKGRCVGNSGLSLFNVRLTASLLPNRSKTPYKVDSSLHRRAARAKLALPPNELAEKFSMERSTKRWFVPFGCHKHRCCRTEY